MSEAEMFVATNLKRTLQSQGRQQRWLASRLGVSDATVSRIVTGTLPVTRARGEAIANLVGAPFFLLFDLHERSVSRSHTAVAS